jgi:hypothetical protein
LHGGIVEREGGGGGSGILCRKIPFDRVRRGTDWDLIEQGTVCRSRRVIVCGPETRLSVTEYFKSVKYDLLIRDVIAGCN